MYLRRAPRWKRPPGQEKATATPRRQVAKAPPPPGRAGSDLGPSKGRARAGAGDHHSLFLPVGDGESGSNRRRGVRWNVDVVKWAGVIVGSKFGPEFDSVGWDGALEDGLATSPPDHRHCFAVAELWFAANDGEESASRSATAVFAGHAAAGAAAISASIVAVHSLDNVKTHQDLPPVECGGVEAEDGARPGGGPAHGRLRPCGVGLLPSCYTSRDLPLFSGGTDIS
ncbi:hypothetical protein ABZP36_007215 [Zizania latifolia]